MKRIPARMARIAVLAVLALSAAGFAAAPVSANTGTTGLRAAPSSFDTLFFCDYVTHDNIAIWEWPGGSGRSGNHEWARVLGVGFNSIPWISSATINGQRWIYGAALIPGTNGVNHIFGWIGRNYLNLQTCGTSSFSSSNISNANTSVGEGFTSNPSETSARFRGQNWVWGIAARASKAGWVGRNYLTSTGCNSSGCHYKIKFSGIHEWVAPGGAAGA